MFLKWVQAMSGSANGLQTRYIANAKSRLQTAHLGKAQIVSNANMTASQHKTLKLRSKY